MQPIERLPEMRPGDVLAGRYHVLQVAGRGATSVVYQARDTLADEVVALKVIRQFTEGSDHALDGFRRELAVSRKIAHPNVIRIHDIGMDGRLFYIVMEYLDGQTLGQQLAAKGRFDAPRFFAVFHQFAEALRWIHQRNIVHRDVKPSNVMFTSDGILKVTDFGIAKELGGTSNTTRIGTPGYASPEQILGQKLTPASDIYSAGAMFFELLTATRPLAKRSLAEQCTLPPPSLSAERPDLPAALCQAIEKCLRPDPADRFQSVDELAAEMASIEGSGSRGSRRRLSDLASENPGELAVLVPLFYRIVNRLREIHASGLTHAQLTPRSIFIAPDGAVQIEAQPLGKSARETLVSEPQYVSPEAFSEGVFAGQPGTVAADIYAVGFLLYEMLVGGAAFKKQFAPFQLGQQDLEWLHWHADLSHTLVPLEEVRPDCPPLLASLVASMTEKWPEQRLPSLEDAAEVLRELSPVAQPLPKATVTPAHGSRFPVKAAVAAGLVILAVVGGWVMLRHPDRPAPQRAARAETPAVVATAPKSPSVVGTLQTTTGTMMLVPKSTAGPLYIDKYEVTNGQYRKFCAQPGHACPASPAWDADYGNKPLRPVIGVTWADADAYCKASGKRLPTDAEWDAAARGADQRKYPWGNWMVPGLANLSNGGTTGGAGGTHTADVGSYPVDVSAAGVWDLAGNAREWVSDDAPDGKKVVRGGSFDFPADQYSLAWKGARLPAADAGVSWPVGFRCAADLEAAPKLQLGK